MCSSAPGRGQSGPAPGNRAAPARPPVFADRAEAGEALGARVRERLRTVDFHADERVGREPVVLAIPRGGVAVAAGVARALAVPLDVLVVRKIGHPQSPELGLGAIAEVAGSSVTAGRPVTAAGGLAGSGEPVFDPGMLAQVGLSAADLDAVVARERAELARRVAAYRVPRQRDGQGRGQEPGGQGPALAGRFAVVVDDGLATGVTARAALRAAVALGAAGTMLAVPVAAPAAVAALQTETGEVVTLVTPRRFNSVGEWYADFGQLTDADVLDVLASCGG
jgi:predicted phosphoribosyltransferase